MTGGEINYEITEFLLIFNDKEIYGQPCYDLSRSMRHIENNLCYRIPRGSGAFRLPNNQSSIANLLT